MDRLMDGAKYIFRLKKLCTSEGLRERTENISENRIFSVLFTQELNSFAPLP